jgi:hypothetical protein
MQDVTTADTITATPENSNDDIGTDDETHVEMDKPIHQVEHAASKTLGSVDIQGGSPPNWSYGFDQELFLAYRVDNNLKGRKLKDFASKTICKDVDVVER